VAKINCSKNKGLSETLRPGKFNYGYEKLSEFHHCVAQQVPILKEIILTAPLVAIVVRLLRRLKKPSRNDDSSLPVNLLLSPV